MMGCDPTSRKGPISTLFLCRLRRSSAEDAGELPMSGLDVTYELSYTDSQSICDPRQGRETAILAALLNVSELRSMHSERIGELFLAEPRRFTT